MTPNTVFPILGIHAPAPISPGPDFAVVTRTAIGSCRRAGRRAAAGVATAIGNDLLIAVLGISLVLAALAGLAAADIALPWTLLVAESLPWFALVALLFSSRPVPAWLRARLIWLDRTVGAVLPACATGPRFAMKTIIPSPCRRRPRRAGSGIFACGRAVNTMQLKRARIVRQSAVSHTSTEQ
ncbi:MAG: hypothetical protein ACJ8HJ_27095 [Massilia sp.]